MDFSELHGSTRCAFIKGDYIIRQDEFIEYIYYLVSGDCICTIVNENGNEYIFNELYSEQGVCSLVGLGMSFDNDSVSTFNVIANTDIICYKIPRPVVLEYLLKYPEELFLFMSKMANNYIVAIRKLNNRQQAKTIERLCQFILDNSCTTSQGILFIKKYSNNQISQFLGIHPVTLSQMFAALRERNFIEKIPRGWRIINVQGLEECACGRKVINYRK